jgi:hypothetical protein
MAVQALSEAGKAEQLSNLQPYLSEAAALRT